MTSPATVTLITPVYNQAAYLGDTIESVLAQTWPHIDYRVIDDGSTDATPDVLARYAGRVATERQANQGQAATLNRGWAGAGSRYLAYLSADDLLAPNAIARMVQTLEADASLVCAYPDSDLIDARGRTIARGVCAPFSLERLVVGGRNPIGPGAVCRADAFARLGGWREDVVLGADRDFWVRIALEGTIGFVPERLAFYRVHRRAISRRPVSEARASDLLRVLTDWFARANLPEGIQARQPEAFANVHREIAGRLLRSGRWRAALRHRRAASARLAAGAGDTLMSTVRLGTRLQILRALAR